ncbi:MAG: hypothetical protein ACLRXQ_07885 [Phascolarctobacterium faecium]
MNEKCGYSRAFGRRLPASSSIKSGSRLNFGIIESAEPRECIIFAA